MSTQYAETEFQKLIVAHLASNGWEIGASANYDRERALYPDDVLAWLALDDEKNLRKIVASDADAKGRTRVLDRLAASLATDEQHGGGTLTVLRKGFDVVGAKRFRMIQQPPADDRNPAMTALYERNILRVVPELRYSMKKDDRLDLAFFVNGIPVATVEMKTNFAQSLGAAIAQYKHDRHPQGEPLLTPGRGALVHFALTQDEIAMTTKLQGEATRFLPFNRGHDGGAGNAPNADKPRTAYFWEDVLDRDAWLQIVTKFVYTNHEKQTDPLTGKVTTRSQIRFPRFHQWRAVTALTAAARADGPGEKYLIQHSAGSGKTDSIAWTAHRLASLHTPAGDKVFDSVIVIADRQVLDRQLQDAVDQLVTVTGTFQAITRGSEGSKTKQLVEALAGGAPIIGVTLQTFPHVLKQMKEAGSPLASKKFAVIADEAHSSQSGSAAAAVREVLYLGEPVAFDDEEPGADQDALVAMAAHADTDARLSYFAFTATPKAKTLELFGTHGSDGVPRPFDLYSMKQAIDEGFILDVLRNYTTYDMAARIAKRAAVGSDEIDPSAGSGTEEIDVRKGTRALIGLVELHPTNIASKVSEILTHFREVVQPQLGGRAKAMIVTSSRAAAVTYARAFEKLAAERDIPVRALVAFSGEVPDPEVAALPGVTQPVVTEASMNPTLKGRDLADVFAQPDHHVLIVANKYQTGFDQPLLVAMYVDKQLSGIAAVQTLSRLNRTTPGKTETYVLDFVNEPAIIQAAFQEYYEEARIETASDPDLVLNIVNKLDAVGIFTWAEVDQVWTDWTSLAGAPGAAHNALSAHLDPAVDRYSARWLAAEDDEERERLLDFRATLAQYATLYAFFSQVLHFGDPRYEKLSVFADLLARRLRALDSGGGGEIVDVSDVVLTHYKLEKLKDEDLGLASGDAAGLRGITEAGMAALREKERASTTELIEKVNVYLGNLDAADEHKVGAIEGLLVEAVRDAGLAEQARNNTKVDFVNSPALQVVLEDAVWTHETASAEVLAAIRTLDGRQLVQLAMDFGLYERLRDRAAG
ncbi:type I restriction endonuclease [uncultured Microbacterium sp.]|uniref:type I restriction endonuclease subunit R n=1 Tax=uncultured Microbacterium sp. TaxID=191216 RepID=UPI0026362435|nr:type I restriction endonuclease [uncultured Microbacterium sp.]